LHRPNRLRRQRAIFGLILLGAGARGGAADSRIVIGAAAAVSLAEIAGHFETSNKRFVLGLGAMPT